MYKRQAWASDERSLYQAGRGEKSSVTNIGGRRDHIYFPNSMVYYRHFCFRGAGCGGLTIRTLCVSGNSLSIDVYKRQGVINPEKKERMALLAEYDALRGLGHACGHCASGSSSVLAALALNEVRDQLDFGVDIIGTPDEEINGTKCLICLLYTSRCV